MQLAETEREHYEERAAIMEYDGGLSREEAERRALEAVLDEKQQESTANDARAYPDGRTT